MAIKVAVHRVCDRCLHPFDESLVKYGAELPKFPEKIIQATSVEGDKEKGTSTTILFHYEDLCSDCERVVDGYIKRIRLDDSVEEPQPKKRNGRKSSEKTPEMTGAIATETSAKEARFEPVELTSVPQPPLETVMPPADPAMPESKITELPGTVSASEKPADTSHPF